MFDAADRTGGNGKCLNDYMLKGPDLLTSLWGIMWGNIKGMFVRIKIRPQDQDALSFLWRSDTTKPVKTYVMTSLIFGAKCFPFVAQFI